jgi:hypothetical protein
MIADMIQEGLTGVYGNVYEPFLNACCHPEILFPRYYNGFNLAESYYMGLQFISWMEIVVGDPLCAPFAEPKPRVYITTNKVIYTSGDTLKVDLDIWNTGSDMNVRLYAAIGIANSLYFHPEWTENPNFSDLQLDVKSRFHHDIIDLELTGDVSPADFVFYAAITDTDGNIIGDLSIAKFETR